MTSKEVRDRYLKFFSKWAHTIIPSASLVPENDPTTLFTGSGMQPLLPYLLGEAHPEGRRLVNSQKCFRAEDIEEIGDNRHTTFFEMLGNWSLGDYGKDKQLPWFFEFLTDQKEGIGLHPNRLYVTVFGSDDRASIPPDYDSAEIWRVLFEKQGVEALEVKIGSADNGARVGMKNGRIFYYDAKKNWWSRAGVPEKMPTGEPGGPDSEVFFDFDPSGKMHDKRFGENCHPNCECGRFMEIGNSVFMEYVKSSDGSFQFLPQKNVDFGGGLERITAAVNNDPDIFRIDTLGAVIAEIEKRSDKCYGADESTTHSFRVVADHLRGAVFMIADGVLPENKERGYFVRRLLRRAVRHMDILGMYENTLHELVSAVAERYRDAYSVLQERETEIRDAIKEEEKKFRATLKKGLQKLTQLIEEHEARPKFAVKERPDSGSRSGDWINAISGKKAFDLYQNYGFPFELIREELAKYALFPHESEFQEEFAKAMQEHQKTSRAGMEKKFHGGLADHSEISIRYHTATHLLHQALRDVLGEHVFQKGSNITPERLRFDFSHTKKMTSEEIKQTEDMVNGKIVARLPVRSEIVPIEEAKKRGAIGLFEETYGDKVKIYIIGEGEDRSSGAYSLEFCGGPHVSNTKELSESGRFRIVKEEAVSAGVRRIKAVLR